MLIINTTYLINYVSTKVLLTGPMILPAINTYKQLLTYIISIDYLVELHYYFIQLNEITTLYFN